MPVWLLVALVASSCQAPVPLVGKPGVPMALLPYADAARFLIPGCSSLSFARQELDPEAATSPAEAPTSCRVARCGSAFEAPKDVGYGRYRGVEVWDFGPGGLHHYVGGDRGMPATGGRADPAVPATPIAGYPVWHVPGAEAPAYVLEVWVAHADDRFLVWSHDGEVLAQALARPGDLSDLLRPFAAVQWLAEDAEHVVCALPRPEDRSYWGRPLPVEPTVSYFRPGPWRLLVLHREPLPQEYANLATNVGPASATTPLGPWLQTEMVEHEGQGDPMMRDLVAELSFGLAIFI